jgi:N-acetylglucosamine kinase-like BadF-type ATPase
MILIADSGSTKTSWCLLKKGAAPLFFETEGYNPYFADTDYIAASLLRGLPPAVDRYGVGGIYFYGAGCFEDKTVIVSAALAIVFPGAYSAVALDLLASARALLGNEPGFVAILGTGANTCLYDGTRIIANIDSLGYLLGDEGSGFYLGRKLLSDYIRGYMPEPVQREFMERYGITREEIMERVYSAPMPNRFCASFAAFLTESIAGGAYMQGLTRQGLRDFFDNLVTRYPDYTRYTFNCVGSVGYSFRELLTEVAVSYGMRVGNILRSPIDGLAVYHSAGN